MHPGDELIASGAICIGECQASAAAVPRVADPAQLLEAGEQALTIDAEIVQSAVCHRLPVLLAALRAAVPR
jgi:hypothetical protein